MIHHSSRRGLARSGLHNDLRKNLVSGWNAHDKHYGCFEIALVLVRLDHVASVATAAVTILLVAGRVLQRDMKVAICLNFYSNNAGWFIVHAHDMPTAFVELHAAIHRQVELG